MLVFIVFGVKEIFGFFSSSVKGESALVVRVSNAVLADARLLQPVMHCGDCVFNGCEGLDDFFHGPMFAIVGKKQDES